MNKLTELEKAPRYIRGITESRYSELHKWLRANWGKAFHCEGIDCLGKSQKYEWALRKGCRYEKSRNCFMQLCKRCHAKMDVTDETRAKISVINKGRVRTDAFKRNLSLSRKGHVVTQISREKSRRSHLKRTSKITFNGESLRVAEWCERYNMSKVTFHYRKRLGWSIEKILTTPKRK